MLVYKFLTVTGLAQVSTCMELLAVFSDPVLQYLLTCLQEARLASAAATALQSISTTCKDKMKAHCDGLIQIAQAVDTFNISNDAATGLLRGMHYTWGKDNNVNICYYRLKIGERLKKQRLLSLL